MIVELSEEELETILNLTSAHIHPTWTDEYLTIKFLRIKLLAIMGLPYPK